MVVAHDTLQAGADAFGQAPTSSLDELHGKSGTDSPGSEKLLQAEVAWSGTLIGVDLGQDTLPPVFGDAELRVELSTLTGTASFDALTVHVEGQSDDFRKTQLEYDIAVTGNSFSDGDRRVRGGFFGPAHEEMAGVLDDRALDVNLPRRLRRQALTRPAPPAPRHSPHHPKGGGKPGADTLTPPTARSAAPWRAPGRGR